MKLKDKVAIVTGAGRGIGKATADALAKEGAKIAALEISEQRAKESADAINKAGGEAIAIRMDVSNSDEIKEAVATVIKHFGRVDILVNNAGIGQIEHFLDGNEERWEKLIAVNFTGLMMLTRAVLVGMAKQKSGKIVNIASDAGILPADKQVVYGAAKGGVVAFTRNLAPEIAKYKVNINAICPGNIETPLFVKGRDLVPDEFKPYYRGMETDIPWGRLGTAEDIAKAVLFLVSDDSDYITGQYLRVDGGVSHYPSV